MSEFDFDTKARDWSRLNAYWLARAAKIAYEWKDTARTELAALGLPEYQAFDAQETQGYIAGNASVMILAFRGTEKKLRDWLTDFDAVLVGGPGGRVHEGFLTALSYVWRDVWDYLQSARKSRPLWVTGHSLGAALATLAVARLRLEKDEPVSGLYTFGQPRTGDREFARNFDADFGARTFRYVNNNDIVPRVPTRVMEYSHVGTFRYFDAKGDERDDISWFDKIVDRFTGNIDEALQPGADGIADHAIARYLACCERAKSTP
jgi:triacylglycerol lipase